MILKGGYHKSIFLLTILLILISSQCLALSNNGQADYILIINSYTESTPWSRIFTTSIYERMVAGNEDIDALSLIHISEPTRLRCISYAVFCLKKKK